MRSQHFTLLSLLLLPLFLLCAMSSQADDNQTRVYVATLRGNVDGESWYNLSNACKMADSLRADLIILDLNTYGGAVDYADTMRTRILNSPIPVWAFVNNQAISAGALITIACDSIYMRPGASIGASTVVDGTGGQLPDKYQSFMRSVMRSTAQAKGKVQKITPEGDTIEVYRRNPDVAQAMVDPNLVVPGIIDSGHVLTLTAQEAMEYNYCEAIVNDISEILERTNIQNPVITEYEPSSMDRFKSFFLSPVVSGILLMLIIGGLYFELQTPGVGFPLIIALAAAAAYFIPLYIDGLVQNIDIILVIVGILLIILEIFVVPGFGITGIAGILVFIVGLTLSMVDNELVFTTPQGTADLLRGTTTVIVALTLAIFGCIFLGGALISSPRIPALALHKNLTAEEGYIAFHQLPNELVGATGTAVTVLRPSGKVVVNGVTYDALATLAYVEKDTPVIIERIENNQIYVTPIQEDIKS